MIPSIHTFYHADRHPHNVQVFGYQDPDTLTGWNISTERQQLISSLMTLGAFVSSCGAGPIAAHVGRRGAIWAAAVLCAVANTLMMASTDIGAMYVGRLVLGLANGLFMTFSQLYIQESVPARYRGLMISSFQVWTSVGTLVGTVVDNFTSRIPTRESYLIPLGLVYIVPVLMSIGLLFIPESPRWLEEHGRSDAALRSLLWHRPYGRRGAEEELRDIREALEQERRTLESSSVRDMFSNPVDRRRTFLAILGISLQGASGAMYMIGAFCSSPAAMILLHHQLTRGIL